MSNQVLFEPSPKQMEFLEAVFSNKYRYILFGGAIRGGKTYALLGAFLLLCKAFPFSRWAIVRDTLPTIKRNTLPSFNKICPKSFISSYNQDTQTVTFKNGSQILFFSENYADDKELNRWKGLEVNGFGLEEVNELQEVSFYKAIERAGSFVPKAGKKPKPLILMTCNPSNNWVKEKIYDKWENGTLPNDWLYIPSKITDNPYIMSDVEYVESLKNLPRYQYEVFVNGNWNIQLKVGGEFYKCFELDKHVGQCKYDPKLPLHISWDDNRNPYLPVGIYQISAKHVKMIDEIYGVNPNNTIKWVCSEIIRKYQGHESGMFVYGDATANKGDTKLEQGYNFFRLITDALKQFHPTNRVKQSNPAIVMRGNWLNTVLENELGGIKITIDESCKKMINDFVLLKEAAEGDKLKEMETDPKTKVRYQKVGHYSDLFDYLMCSAFYDDFLAYQRGNNIPKPSFSKQSVSKQSY
jgi:hypothetical protein